MDQMKLRYLGQCGFAMEGNGVCIVTDPYFSDYVDRNCCTENVLWKRLYGAPCALEDLKPDAVLISHSHYDHMDPDTIAPYVRAGGKAVFAAPAPVAEDLRRLGPENVIEARAEQSFDIGGVRVTPIPCAHTQMHTDEAGRFYELSYLINFGDGDVVFFGGDLSLYDGLAQRLRQAGVKLMLLPANGRDAWRDANDIIGNTTAEEAAALAAELNAAWVPMHHDLYEINRCPAGEPERMSEKLGARIYPMALMGEITMEKGDIHA